MTHADLNRLQTLDSLGADTTENADCAAEYDALHAKWHAAGFGRVIPGETWSSGPSAPAPSLVDLYRRARARLDAAGADKPDGTTEEA